MACKRMESEGWTKFTGRQVKHRCSNNSMPISLPRAIVYLTMKSSFAVALSLSFFLTLLCVYPQRCESVVPTYLYHYCPNTTLFTPNYIYQSNHNTVFSSLYSAATDNADGFANASAGENPPDNVHGIFLCRADVDVSTCNDCLAFGTKEILRRCPNHRVSIIWYDECMVRYSNASIYSVMEQVPAFIMYNTGNISDPTRFLQVLGQAMDDIATRVSDDEVGKKVAVNATEFTSLQNLYTFAQCTPDLTEPNCDTCLRAAIASLPQGKQGGRTFTPSCSVRFEVYPFYNATAVATPSPPPSQIPPPPAPATTPQEKTDEVRKSDNSAVITVAITVPVGGTLVLFCLTCFFRRKGKKAKEAVKGIRGSKELTTVESLQFDFAALQAATNDFSLENKLGEGGFGEVFQGRLPDGQQIAVKRLSQSSRQGNEEFKNEVMVVAKLQHKNLVRLLGFCLEGDEKLLAYEFMPNKSLDYLLFDPQKSGQVDWSSRYNIVIGIARGMLYLHEDSRLRIIHRDLKCSNILLDSEMNPKILDFGMARIFAINQTQASTNKIVGTYGYMSPEYAMHGEFSMKSDVYSFGILVLEIICGKRNNFYHQLGEGEYLTSFAWNQWREGTPLKVLDPAIMDSYSRDEVLRCLHICLLCIQEDPTIRPTMATIVLMLSSNSITPPSPQRPAFFVQSRLQRLSVPMEELELDEYTRRPMPLSANHISLTELYPR